MSIELKNAIGSLNHADDAQWTAGGLPLPTAVTIALGQPGIEVTAEEIAAVAPDYRRMSPEELAGAAISVAGNDDEDSRPEQDDPRLRKATAEAKGLEDISKMSVSQARAEKAKLDAEYVDVDRELSRLSARKNEINKQRDKLLPVLEPQAGNTLSETIQAYQRRSHAVQADRVESVRRVNEVLGGTLGNHHVAGSPSPLDASRQVNRAHGAGMKRQPGVVVKPVDGAPQAA